MKSELTKDIKVKYKQNVSKTQVNVKYGLTEFHVCVLQHNN